MTDDSDVAGEPGDAQHDGEGSTADRRPAVTVEDTRVDTDGPFGIDAVRDAFEAVGRPLATATEVGGDVDLPQGEVSDRLDELATAGDLERVDVSTDPVVYFPSDLSALTARERVIVFPDRRELVVHHPDQFTRAQLSQFANLVDTNREGGYIYEIRDADVWQAPYDEFADLRQTMREVFPTPQPDLEEWVRGQWERARRFRLYTHEDGYVVLEADSDDLMGNVARQRLDDELRAPIGDTESWVAEGSEASVKRTLYDAGYPVQDDRDLDTGEGLTIGLDLSLRDYQRDWVDRFLESGAGVFVGPPGSGKTVAAMGVMSELGGETLVLVPSRELAEQWRDEIVSHTSLDPVDVGVYHGGEKTVRPVTVATYQVAAMDRHRQLFDQRRWGLIVYDEVHHIPASLYKVSADLQSKARLGLSATPVRGDDREEEIFTLVGPPIGTDWSALFDAGFVAEPEVEIRMVPWPDDDARNEYGSADRHERRRVAANNPGKIEEIRYLLAERPDAKALVFVDWLDQGRDIADALGVPFVSGETRHAERERLFGEFRRNERDTLVISRVGDEGIDLPNAELAVVASGLGGSRRQGTQRAGRTMRPVGGARLVLLATQGTTEEDFVRKQTHHLAEKGIRVRETGAATAGEADDDEVR